MSVVGIGDNLQSLMAGLDIEQLLRKKKGEGIIPETGTELLSAAGSLAAEIAAERHSVGSGGSSNPMDRNFVRRDREESRYVSATLKGLRAEGQMEDARQSSATALLDQFGGVNVSGTYYPSEGGHSDDWYKKQLKQKDDQRMMEEAAERMRRERKQERERTEKALVAPADGEDVAVGITAGAVGAGIVTGVDIALPETVTAAVSPAAAVEISGAAAAAAAPAASGSGAAKAAVAAKVNITV